VARVAAAYNSFAMRSARACAKDCDSARGHGVFRCAAIFSRCARGWHPQNASRSAYLSVESLQIKPQHVTPQHARGSPQQQVWSAMVHDTMYASLLRPWMRQFDRRQILMLNLQALCPRLAHRPLSIFIPCPSRCPRTDAAGQPEQLRADGPALRGPPGGGPHVAE